MKRRILLSLLAAVALSLSASVRQTVPQRSPEAILNPSDMKSEKQKANDGDLRSSLFAFRSLKPAATAVAPSPRVQPLLRIVSDPSIKAEDQKLADEILRIMIPSSCIGNLKNFYISYNNTLKSRGYAGKDTIIVKGGLPRNEMIGLLIHEASHFRDLSGCIAGSPRSGASTFKDGKDMIYNDDPSVAFYSISWATENIKKQGTAAEDFATGYAGSNPFEDLAESATLYMLHQDDFKLRAKKNKALAAKLAWIEANFFPGGKVVAVQTGKYDRKIPWDATKLAFTWNGVQRVAAR